MCSGKAGSVEDWLNVIFAIFSMRISSRFPQVAGCASLVFIMPDSRMKESFPQASHEIKFKPRIAIKENTHRRETSMPLIFRSKAEMAKPIRTSSYWVALLGVPKVWSTLPVSVSSPELFNNECRFFKGLCVKPTIYGSTTTYHREWVDLTQYNFSNDPLNAFRWYRSRTVLPKPTLLCRSEK